MRTGWKPQHVFLRTMLRCLLSLMLLSWSTGHAQVFDLDQFEQLFRPRLRLEGRLLPEVMTDDRSGTYADRSLHAVMTFPIHSRFKVDAQLDLKAKNIGELLKNGLRVRASQVMGSLRYGLREVRFDPLLEGPRTLHTVSIGSLGISLTRKYRILFWSLNMNVSEEDRTLARSVPRFGGVLGKMKVSGARRQFLYGVALGISDGLTLPVPFIGGSVPMGRSWSFNYVLPLQLSTTCKLGASTRLIMGAGLDGARSGIEVSGVRANINHAGLRLFASARHRINRYFVLRAELGYLATQRVDLDGATGEAASMPSLLMPGPVVNIGVNVLFGESVLQRILDDILAPRPQ